MASTITRNPIGVAALLRSAIGLNADDAPRFTEARLQIALAHFGDFHERAELPTDFPARLAAKANHLYPRNRHFHKVLNRPGNRGRDNLYVYMRHWTASWLKRECSSLFQRLPWSYALGNALPEKLPDRP